MNTPNSNLPEPPKDLRRICPFLGQIDDPETSLAFPSDQNYCHCAVPPGVPRPDYQMSHCLTASFSACPVYAGKEKGPLPADMRLQTNGGRGPIQIFPLLRILGAILIAVLVFMIGWFGVAGLTKSFNESNAANTKARIPVIATLTPFAPVVTHTLPHFPTLTQQPSDTPTETLHPANNPCKHFQTGSTTNNLWTALRMDNLRRSTRGYPFSIERSLRSFHRRPATGKLYGHHYHPACWTDTLCTSRRYEPDRTYPGTHPVPPD